MLKFLARCYLRNRAVSLNKYTDFIEDTKSIVEDFNRQSGLGVTLTYNKERVSNAPQSAILFLPTLNPKGAYSVDIETPKSLVDLYKYSSDETTAPVLKRFITKLRFIHAWISLRDFWIDWKPGWRSVKNLILDREMLLETIEYLSKNYYVFRDGMPISEEEVNFRNSGWEQTADNIAVCKILSERSDSKYLVARIKTANGTYLYATLDFDGCRRDPSKELNIIYDSE